MDQSTLITLLTKYQQGTCNTEELQQIDTWYAGLDTNTAFDKQKASRFLQQLDHADADFEQRLYLDFLNKLQQEKESETSSSITDNLEQQRISHHKQFFKKLKIACSIIAILGLSLWALRTLTDHKDFENQTAKLADSLQPAFQIGMPGQNRAILKLAGGQTIILDTLQNGLIATQGGMQLINKAGTLNFATLTKEEKQNKTNQKDAGAALTGNNILQTAPGEQYKLILPDGTKVWLNAASSLEFPASFAHLKTRTVKLEGEAYFEVVHNSNQPFTVQTAHQTIEDIGTAFNVSAYKDDPFTKTTLLEGAVQVRNTASRQITTKTRSLVPGQQASSSNADMGSGDLKVTRIDTDGVIAWKNGYFQFEGEDIYAIMRRVSRWYKVQVVYDGPIPKSRMEGSMSRFERVSKVLNIIEKTGLFEFKTVGNTIHVSAP
ncbi:DUF4974 domain-containing protein [Arachidicoccus ginsenosidivorans]|uniref:DUF4974 domain-containing protein n=1 Tax=Arachidicoccus ginsenosidivorans TaxID=496057 RepID=A0A5B8VTJ2_9BACT|nr:FecR family protein [Arachidicoccus ginsenosidivorans]QEC74086.1 DUF4974 domain-containing protein [Arachidicoccus ginsenosidivorans]